MHVGLALIYLVTLLVAVILNNLTCGVFLIFFIAYNIVIFYTATGISMSIYRKKVENVDRNR